MQQTATNYKEQVMQALKWDALKYAEFQEEMGIRFLKSVLLGGDETWLSELTRCRIFWQWWINQWNIRDKQFIECRLYASSLHNAVENYEYLHNPITLRTRPHKGVMEETYAVMMQGFIDETMKAAC
jgi:hypothetical protein